jgi:acetyltransferase-like isoleucine patch superfamily enzyme
MQLQVSDILSLILDKALLRLIVRPAIAKAVRQALLEQPAIFGDETRVTIAPNAIIHNTLFNVASGRIIIEEDVFFGHNVSLLTGTHDSSAFGPERMMAVPSEGRDITVARGAWIASNATIIGPANIGAHAVVAAGSLVIGDVPPLTIVAGVPAKLVRRCDHSSGQMSTD